MPLDFRFPPVKGAWIAPIRIAGKVVPQGTISSCYFFWRSFRLKSLRITPDGIADICRKVEVCQGRFADFSYRDMRSKAIKIAVELDIGGC